jgi:ABC-type phosphate transport system permease subunit
LQLILPLSPFLQYEASLQKFFSSKPLTKSIKFERTGAMEKDLEHLKLLGIFHYIWGGLSLVGGLFIGAYFLVIGFVLMSNPSGSTSSEDSQSASVAGGVLIVVGVVLFLIVVIYGVLTIMAGGKYRKHQGGYWFCFILAIVTLVIGGIPGIVLGIFSLIVLSRESVKALFRGQSLPGTGSVVATPPVS